MSRLQGPRTAAYFPVYGVLYVLAVRAERDPSPGYRHDTLGPLLFVEARGLEKLERIYGPGPGPGPGDGMSENGRTHMIS